MTVTRLIAELESRNIILSLAGEELRYRSPKDALTNADRESLRSRRAEIVAYLKTRMAARALRTAGALAGPLMPAVGQEMWRQFAGGPREGDPVALNIGMVGRFRHRPEEVRDAIHQLIGRYDALRAGFRPEGTGLKAYLNPAESFDIEQEDLRGLSPDAALAAAQKGAAAFCALLNAIDGGWLTRARLFALPDGESLAAISSAHMIADAGTRNIVLDELHDILEQGGAQNTPSLAFHDYSLAERQVLESDQGAQLIDYWRRWYLDQPQMKAPDGTLLQWGNGIRIVKNFTIPGRMLDKVRALAAQLKVTPFLIFLTIFSRSLARWSGMEQFPLRILGDKRTALDVSNTVGLMFCADAVEIHAPQAADFESVMRAILAAYDTALAMRIPTLHFWAPHCVKPGIEAPDYPNFIPAVFNYYSVGTAREKAERQKQYQSAADTSAHLPWPPTITTLSQDWPRRSSPLFLHVMDLGHEAQLSLHFYQGVVSPADQESFTRILFQIFAETVPD